MFKKIKKNEGKDNTEMSVQDWLPFEDVAGHFILGRDKKLVAVLRVEPLNMVLRSENEKKRIINAVHEAWNGIQYSLQILCLPRPVDLDKYLEKLEENQREADMTRKRILREYIQYISGIVRGGEALERRYYILLAIEEGKYSREELLKRAHELASHLGNSGLQIEMCDDLGIIDMLFSFLHPLQSAFENPASVFTSNITLYREER